MPRPISLAEPTPVRVVIVTQDGHMAAPVAAARPRLRAAIPGLQLSLHAASDYVKDPQALARARADIARADIVIAGMLFIEEHFTPVLDAFAARRHDCDAYLGVITASEVSRLTRLGDFALDKPQAGPMALLKRLRGKREGSGSSGQGQMKMLRRLPKILRFIPGKAQDLRAFFLSMQYWLAGSSENIEHLVRFLVNRYAAGPRAHLRGTITVADPVEYPDCGVYHPRMRGRVSDDAADLPQGGGAGGTIGLLIMRSYVLAGDTAHYDGVIAAFEARGMRVIPAFAAGLDARPAIESFFHRDGRVAVDAVVSLTGFSLVGGPAYNDSAAAEQVLAGLDVPYVAAHALEFQTLDQWGSDGRGLSPIESTIMIAIPEIDGATGPTVFGGRMSGPCSGCARRCPAPHGSAAGSAMLPCPDRCEVMADRVQKLVRLRRTPRAERRLAVVLYGFPPNAGAVGTAANLGVMESLFNTLHALRAEGWRVEVPESVDALRSALLDGNARQHGTQANVHARIPADRLVAEDPFLAEIEAAWGPAPGKAQSNGAEVFILGRQFGQVFVGVQPVFGYEGDPMRLLFETGFAPTHAFAAFYRWLHRDWDAHAVLHFGTHGALEFMPGKQAGMSGNCWSDRLIGTIPHLYLYSANNPSEATIAKRRGNATTISHLTPPLTRAGLYKGLVDLKVSVERWRALPPDSIAERHGLEELIQAQAVELDLATAQPVWNGHAAGEVQRLWLKILEMEATLIPHGLHVVGRQMTLEERADLLAAMSEAEGRVPERLLLEALAAGGTARAARTAAGLRHDSAAEAALAPMVTAARHLATDSETPAILHALDGGFVRPVPGGDLVRTPAILPTGRNIHGFDPFRLPSAYAMKDGAAQAERLLARHVAEGNRVPRSVALVLWGTDNLKTEGGPIAQALALMGTAPRFDSYGRLAGARLIPLAELGRARVDVVMTLSGIFRDLLPLQTRLLAEAAALAAEADEALEMNPIRAHALSYQAAHGCDFETASLRVFSNADGAYGSNVNQLIDSGAWGQEDELAEAFQRRKSFAYGRNGRPTQQSALMGSMLADVELAYQNLESVELGVTTIDHYFDTLGGIGRAVRRARGGTDAPVYIGDQTRGEGTVRTLGEQVALETRTRALNPRWYEGMLKHGHEGVRQIEAQVTNTMGWSATTGAVDPWVYQRLSETFVLDEAMRRRLADLNPAASARMANRLLEAHERAYWTPDARTLEALTAAGEELEDRLEGVDTAMAQA